MVCDVSISQCSRLVVGDVIAIGVVGGATQIDVVGIARLALGFQRQGLQVVFQDGLYAAVGAGPEVQCPLASRFEPWVANTFSQTNDAQCRAEALLGMRTAFHDVFDQLGTPRADGFCPLQDSTGSPF